MLGCGYQIFDPYPLSSAPMDAFRFETTVSAGNEPSQACDERSVCLTYIDPDRQLLIGALVESHNPIGTYR